MYVCVYKDIENIFKYIYIYMYISFHIIVI